LFNNYVINITNNRYLSLLGEKPQINVVQKDFKAMNELYVKLRRNLGLSLILLIGLGVEFSNFQSMFYKFMLQYRPDWGAFNHVPAMFLSAFLLLCIVIFGIRKQVALSWFLALLTCVVSFAVYSRMNLSWNWEEMNEIHFVVLILSGMLPLLVAYTTHQIAHDNEDEFEHLDEILDDLKKSQYSAARSSGQLYPYNGKKKMNGAARTTNYEREQMIRSDGRKGKYGIGESFEEAQNDTRDEEMYYRATQAPAQKYNGQQPEDKNEQREQFYNQSAQPNIKAESPVLKSTPKVVVPPVMKKTSAPVVEEERAVQYAEKREIILPVSSKEIPENKVPGGYLVKCAHCGKESVKKSSRAKYCSVQCRSESAKGIVRMNGSQHPGGGHDFLKTRDEFDSAGIMEWIHVDNL
jgi:hypothetical protein